MFDKWHNDKYSTISDLPLKYRSLYALIQSVPNHNLLDPNDILMPTTNHQSHNLSQTRYWKALFFLFQLQFLQRINLVCLVTFRSEYDPVRAFFDMIEAGVVVYGQWVDWDFCYVS